MNQIEQLSFGGKLELSVCNRNILEVFKTEASFEVPTIQLFFFM